MTLTNVNNRDMVLTLLDNIALLEKRRAVSRNGVSNQRPNLNPSSEILIGSIVVLENYYTSRVICS